MGSSLSIRRVDYEEYSEVMRSSRIVFNGSSFLELNSDKTDSIHYLLVEKGHSVRFAAAFGVREGIALCPFSAPFGYPESQKEEIPVGHYVEAGTLVDEYLQSLEISKSRMVLPPSFYDHNDIETWKNVFFNLGWKIECIDLSFAFNLSKIGRSYESALARNARKNLAIARRSNLELRHCESDAEAHEAYSVIRENREFKGYPLRMSERQVMETMRLVASDMYLVLCDEIAVAAALVYKVSSDCAQVVYWGDRPGNSDKKPINFLSAELVKRYFDEGLKYLDVGPSTEDGVPNLGLCDFKDGLGCERSSKVRMVKSFKVESNSGGAY